MKVTRPLNVDIQLATRADFDVIASTTGLVLEYSAPGMLGQIGQNWRYTVYQGKIIGVNL